MRYYVAIGASQALGIQSSASGGEHQTSEGYTNDLVAAERARWPGLKLVVFACPGLRMEMALDGGRAAALPSTLKHVAAGTTTGRCRSTQSKVGLAAAFIRSHPGQVVLVTVDLGDADVAACLVGKTVDSACVTDALARDRAGLPAVVSRLRAAGGSSLRIVGLNHEDPLLADYLGKSDSDRAFAEASAAVTERFSQVADAAYGSVRVPVAQVAAAFGTGDTTPVKLSGSGTVPLDVARVCALTWMCVDGDIHPNTQGYRKIASAVEAALAATLP